MNANNILNYLNENELSDVEVLKYEDEDVAVLRFFYDFDEPELNAAKAYANDECEEDENTESWVQEFFIPYLNELAVDNAGEIIENLMEDFDIKAQYISYEVNEEEPEYSEFIAVFYEKDKDVDIEEVLEKLEI